MYIKGSKHGKIFSVRNHPLLKKWQIAIQTVQGQYYSSFCSLFRLRVQEMIFFNLFSIKVNYHFPETIILISIKTQSYKSESLDYNLHADIT